MKKQHLPTKLCVVCDRPFAWRKKWKTCWDEVKYCSERCRRNRNPTTSLETSNLQSRLGS